MAMAGPGGLEESSQLPAHVSSPGETDTEGGRKVPRAGFLPTLNVQ